MPEEKKQFLLQVRGQDPIAGAVPIYSNFVAVSRVGTDVQFEFIFLDLNQLAQLSEQAKSQGISEPIDIQGKTVAKVVVPGTSFVHIKEHLLQIFEALEGVLKVQEVGDERTSTGAGKFSGPGIG